MANVDTSLPPELTGAAAELGKRHAEEHPLKLYGGWFCPYVQRAWIALHEKRVPHQYVEINPYKKDPEFVAMNPRGLVPTLAVPVPAPGEEEKRTGSREHKPLYESAVVVEYIDEAFADEEAHGPRLLPEGAYERARCRIWIDHICTRVVPGFYKLLQHTADKSYSLEQARGELLGRIRELVEQMDDAADGPWFLGGRFSMVDLMLAPWAKRLWLIDHYKEGGVGIPREGDRGHDAVWARWDKWFAAVTERQSVRDTWSADERYLASYKRYAEDTTNSQVGQATRRGERLP